MPPKVLSLSAVVKGCRLYKERAQYVAEYERGDEIFEGRSYQSPADAVDNLRRNLRNNTPVPEFFFPSTN